MQIPVSGALMCAAGRGGAKCYKNATEPCSAVRERFADRVRYLSRKVILRLHCGAGAQGG
jgi:hypothetical protein